MGRYGFGQRVLRTEDPRLLRGEGRFSADIELPRQAYGYVLRSPHAHAEIHAIEVARAARAPGVLAVLTARDADADGLGTFPVVDNLLSRDGGQPFTPRRGVLAQERARYVGEPVAFVVAESLDNARDAAELVEVSFAPLASVTDTALALSEGAPTIWPRAPLNLALDWAEGDRAATERAFARARHVTRLSLVNNRVMAVPMEPNAALGAYDAGEGRYTLHTPSQGVHVLREDLARHVLKIPETHLRVVSPDVGGGFGVRFFALSEHALVLWASRRIGRPVKWVAERAESMLIDCHARDHVTEAELALDGDGRFLAVRARTIANLGAYVSRDGRVVPTKDYAAAIVGAYAIPAFRVEVKAVFTNTVMTASYRGAGRPEGIYVIERLADLAAVELGLSPVELRRRNLVPRAAMPYRSATGELYDSGDFAKNLVDALALADRDGIEARKAAARARGRRRGLGLSTYVKINGGMPDEMAEIRLAKGGEVELLIGSQPNGQGHATAYAQLVAERLGVPFEIVRVVQGDSDRVPYGQGTGGSSALSVGGSAVVAAAERVIESGRAIASHLLEAAEPDLAFADGRFTVKGTDR
ncbi:MAG: xanthine dehydrogenase family protein molybdopterin-binding subunit [Alphaproteobacteria bacterium]